MCCASGTASVSGAMAFGTTLSLITLSGLFLLIDMGLV